MKIQKFLQNIAWHTLSLWPTQNAASHTDTVSLVNGLVMRGELRGNAARQARFPKTLEGGGSGVILL